MYYTITNYIAGSGRKEGAAVYVSVLSDGAT